MAEQPETIMEVVETLVVSPKGGNPVLKNAHFLKPMLAFATKTPEKPHIYLPFKPVLHNVTFKGWENPKKDWIFWLDRLHSTYQYIWRRAGIYDAILSSKYKVVRNDDLFFGLAERWCSETNTFVFPWGEATVTLEDVMVLGGYSVLGDSVSGKVVEKEVVEIERKLLNIHGELSRRKSQKALHCQWLKHFEGGETGVEHEAFLVYWLSRFVLPTFPHGVICKKFFKIAIFLARGTPIALAPVVLASLYRDLTLLKSITLQNGVCDGKLVNGSDKVADCSDEDLFVVTLWGPLQLVQAWAWERFPEFRPNPRVIEYGEPRMARWHEVSEVEIGNVRPMLVSAGDTFEWRPYCKRVDNLPSPPFYRDDEAWELVDVDIGDDARALIRFLRVCELVGVDSIEQYNPHRVAMQFGYDQDVPQRVGRWLVGVEVSKKDAMQLAWMTYTNPINDPVLYIPSKFRRPMVTVRFLEWHRRGVLTSGAAFVGVVRKRRSSKRSRKSRVIKVETRIDSELVVPPGFRSNAIFDQEVNVPPRPPGFPPTIPLGDEPHAPPGFRPKTRLSVPLHSETSHEHHSLGVLNSVVKLERKSHAFKRNFTPLQSCTQKLCAFPTESACHEGERDANRAPGKSVDQDPGRGCRSDSTGTLISVAKLEENCQPLSRGNDTNLGKSSVGSRLKELKEVIARCEETQQVPAIMSSSRRMESANGEKNVAVSHGQDDGNHRQPFGDENISLEARIGLLRRILSACKEVN